MKVNPGDCVAIDGVVYKFSPAAVRTYEYLIELFPQEREGSLSKKRASLVNEEVMAYIATQMGLSNFMLLGKGEQKSGGAQKPRLLASALEALFGAVFEDGGYSASRILIRSVYKEMIQAETYKQFTQDYKSQLQELVQVTIKVAPVYTVVSESGPTHERSFVVNVAVVGRVLAEGEGRSKKIAEQMAAQKGIAKWLSGDSK